MKTLFEKTNDQLIMRFEGRFDTTAAAQAEIDMKVLDDCKGRDIVLDCTNLQFISSSGLRLFLGTLKSAKAKGSRVIIKGINDDIRSIFVMTGFISLFEFA